MFLKLAALQMFTYMLISVLWGECGADVFSAMFKMEHLLDTRQRVIHQLEDYIHKEENRLRELKMYSTMYKREHERAMKDITHYTGNPINAFILIKRLTSDLDDIEKRINKTTEFVSIRNVSEDDNNATILYPTAVDLQGAALALKRLQRTYKLKVQDLARGVLKRAVNRHPLTASDCYEIGVIMLERKDYLNALAWQMEAMRKYKLEDSIPHSITEIDIMENIATLYNLLSDPETALEWTMKILTLDPYNELAKDNARDYEIQIRINNGELNSDESDALRATTKTNDDKKENSTKTATDGKDEIFDENKEADIKDNSDDDNDISENDQAKTVNSVNHTDIDFIKTYADMKNGTDTCTSVESTDSSSSNGSSATVDDSATLHDSTKSDTNATNGKSEMYRRFWDGVIDLRKDIIMSQALCRGEYDIALEISSRLTCHYLNDKPFLKLAPIKAEQRYINPDVFLFHDVISDEEIEQVKKIAKPHLRRATVVGAPNSNSSKNVVDYRISQSKWLSDKEDEDDANVVARLTQRVNDFTGLNMNYAEFLQVANYGVGGYYDVHYDYMRRVLEGRERIATAMFYMSDVTQGGATVFPKLGLSVFPVKGSAIFWMNLLPSGEGNRNTRHAACPVLEGCKQMDQALGPRVHKAV